jgi:L-rhamnose isomerase / sugar isomerase
LAYAQALIIDREKLWEAQESNDVVMAQEIMQNAFRTDVRPLLAEARLRSGAAIDPLSAYRNLDVRNTLIHERGFKSVSTGL